MYNTSQFPNLQKLMVKMPHQFFLSTHININKYLKTALALKYKSANNQNPSNQNPSSYGYMNYRCFSLIIVLYLNITKFINDQKCFTNSLHHFIG